jgi:S-formylglutathione hydrolase FrmB
VARSVSRRTLLVAGGATGVVVVAGAAAAAAGVVPVPTRVRRLFADDGPGPVPDAPEGVVRLERVESAARGRAVGLWTAVPHGYGDGAALPVCLVLHGASATTADYSRFGLGRFLTAAVVAGSAPFVLAGADGGRSGWLPNGSDDPRRMLTEELPAWCRQRGFDAGRLAAYGWSMGGFGALALAEDEPRLLRAVSALSPAVGEGDAVLAHAGRLDGRRVALWCGTDDPLLPSVQDLARRVPGGTAVAAWAPGAHTRRYWNRVTPAAFAFVGHALASGGS